MLRLKTIPSFVIASVFALTVAATTALAVETIYYGSSKSDKYHLPSCKWAQKITSDNLVVFKSKDDAAAKGYQPCKVCRP